MGLRLEPAWHGANVVLVWCWFLLVQKVPESRGPEGSETPVSLSSYVVKPRFHYVGRARDRRNING